MKNTQFKLSKLTSSIRVGDDGADADDAPQDTFTKEQLEAEIAKRSAEVVSEVESRLNKKNKELVGELKSAKEVMKKFEGIDVEKVRAMNLAMENDQDLKDISEGRHEEVIQRRMERERVKYESEVNNFKTENETLKEKADRLEGKVTNLMIDNNVVSDFVKEKGFESAIEDVKLRARSIWKVEGEETIARDAKGDIITGANGPLTITEWVNGLKETAPHLFPSSNGSGAQNSTGEQLTGIEAKIQKAIQSGDQDEYRRLRKMQKENK
jgi:hypothetical protein